MDSFEKTTYFHVDEKRQNEGFHVTIFDGSQSPITISFSDFKKNIITFGRDSTNDIVLSSKIVSKTHGRFIFKENGWYIEDKSVYEQRGSTNGLVYNNMSLKSKAVVDGDIIRIDDKVETIAEGVLFLFSNAYSGNKWNTVQTADCVSIGRNAANAICLPHISVSKKHAIIQKENNEWYIYDTKSTNGVIVNGRTISEKTRLHEKDVITITNSKIIFTTSVISYCCYKNGVSVDCADIVIKRGKGKKSFVTCNHVNLGIKPGELVAIIGGSGAGKSTILNCLCGYLKPGNGEVYINGIDLYNNFDSLKKFIGYVPQNDIVYNNLTLRDMLLYTAKLRLPPDVSAVERERAIDRAIETVELTEKKNSMIKSLSGGQRKRASIAVELLSDPNLLFLDEPASGLDPGTERNLMMSLRKMADSDKTVILVTHSTLQLKLCDKIVFMGKGGNLCFCGSYDEALKFFGVRDIVDVYNMITDYPVEWAQRYEQISEKFNKVQKTAEMSSKAKKKTLSQIPVLCKRYAKLVINDKQRLLLLLLQAPLLALLISLVADGNEFTQYEMTKSLLFALSCSAFWIGMLNSIQEICKERNIMKREYMTGLSLTAYISSKIIVLGLLSLIQSLLVTGVFALLVGMPSEGVMFLPYVEILLTTFVTAIASVAMGLLVSSLFTNPDRAMTVAPILLMPQILFSGLIFTLDGATKIVSWFAICRWSMEGFGTTANLNVLPLNLQQQGLPLEHIPEDFFEFTTKHMMFALGVLVGFTVLFLVLSRIIIGRIKNEKS